MPRVVKLAGEPLLHKRFKADVAERCGMTYVGPEVARMSDSWALLPARRLLWLSASSHAPSQLQPHPVRSRSEYGQFELHENLPKTTGALALRVQKAEPNTLRLSESHFETMPQASPKPDQAKRNRPASAPMAASDLDQILK
ncbi:MAG: hypothetical protein DWI24_10705 [Planctomycetota bacterium]|nr:MAG: hypothetical protein DWI24_10705 [Planctomycetota bacterium]